jgi:outer membrane protein assembly factor BamB
MPPTAPGRLRFRRIRETLAENHVLPTKGHAMGGVRGRGLEPFRIAFTWTLCLFLVSAVAAPSQAAGGVVEAPDGSVLRSIGPDGSVLAERLPPRPAPSPSVERVLRDYTDPAGGRTVDPEGRVSGEATGLAAMSSLTVATIELRRTIDRMAIRHGSARYDLVQGLPLFSSSVDYTLNDGSTWNSGAGSFYVGRAHLGHVEVVGSTIRYHLQPPADGIFFSQTDFNAGDHSAQGTLALAGPLVLEGESGSPIGILRGEVELVSNDATWYGEPRFHYYSAPVGAVLPFELTCTLAGGAGWSPTTFDGDFTCSIEGSVDFASPVSMPRAVDLAIQGADRLPESTTTQLYAIIRYENDVLRDVTAEANWSVEPPDAGSVGAGELTTSADCAGVDLVVRAATTEHDTDLAAAKTITCLARGSAGELAGWVTFQGDERHSGFVPISLETSVFRVRWQRDLGQGVAVNQVAAADGKVFASLALRFQDVAGLFVLDDRDGDLLWSRGFGRVNSVNPPAYGYGNVYIQTGNHSNDTFLWAFSADTGAEVFRAPHAAQWERYLAPTVYDGNVYVNGGYYGGMYSFSAFSGAQNWFLGLPQYDRWTPAVDEQYAYAYVGEYQPGLYVIDRLTGNLVTFISDPNFDWNGWSMNLAPVLGEMDDVLAIHNGRILRFDVASRSIAWELEGSFVGQPSVAEGVIYAIAGGALVARDQETGAPRWSWSAADGPLTSNLVVTNTHVLAATATTLYAVELLSGDVKWSHPVSGHLALGGETVYVASADGVLTAISTPEYTPAALVGLEVDGPDQVTENGTGRFQALARYSDGRVRDRSELATWSVEPNHGVGIDAGELTVGELLTPSREVLVRASYSEGATTVEDARTVELVIGVSLDEFVERNLLAARLLKHHAIADLGEADERERAAMSVLTGEPKRGQSVRRALEHLRKAQFWGWFSRSGIERAVDELDASLRALGGDPEQAADRNVE